MKRSAAAAGIGGSQQSQIVPSTQPSQQKRASTASSSLSSSMPPLEPVPSSGSRDTHIETKHELENVPDWFLDETIPEDRRQLLMKLSKIRHGDLFEYAKPSILAGVYFRNFDPDRVVLVSRPYIAAHKEKLKKMKAPKDRHSLTIAQDIQITIPSLGESLLAAIRMDDDDELVKEEQYPKPANDDFKSAHDNGPNVYIRYVRPKTNDLVPLYYISPYVLVKSGLLGLGNTPKAGDSSGNIKAANAGEASIWLSIHTEASSYTVLNSKPELGPIYAEFKAFDEWQMAIKARIEHQIIQARSTPAVYHWVRSLQADYINTELENLNKRKSALSLAEFEREKKKIESGRMQPTYWPTRKEVRKHMKKSIENDLNGIHRNDRFAKFSHTIFRWMNYDEHKAFKEERKNIDDRKVREEIAKGQDQWTDHAKSVFVNHTKVQDYPIIHKLIDAKDGHDGALPVTDWETASLQIIPGSLIGLLCEIDTKQSSTHNTFRIYHDIKRIYFHSVHPDPARRAVIPVFSSSMFKCTTSLTHVPTVAGLLDFHKNVDEDDYQSGEQDDNKYNQRGEPPENQMLEEELIPLSRGAHRDFRGGRLAGTGDEFQTTTASSSTHNTGNVTNSRPPITGGGQAPSKRMGTGATTAPTTVPNPSGTRGSTNTTGVPRASPPLQKTGGVQTSSAIDNDAANTMVTPPLRRVGGGTSGGGGGGNGEVTRPRAPATQPRSQVPLTQSSQSQLTQSQQQPRPGPTSRTPGPRSGAPSRAGSSAPPAPPPPPSDPSQDEIEEFESGQSVSEGGVFVDLGPPRNASNEGNDAYYDYDA